MTARFQIIGLTGGIGAGKSAASARFVTLGAHLIDADALARSALDAGGACFHDVIQAFGHSIMHSDGSIDRKALANIVFSDEKERKRLNTIVHPRVIADMLRQAHSLATADKDAVIILDVPLLFECGMDKDVDQTLLVYADDALRIERLLIRDGCTSEAAAARIRVQMPQEEKRRRADYLISNNGPTEALCGQVDALYQWFRSKRH